MHTYDRRAMSLAIQLQGTFTIRPGNDNASKGDGGSQFGVHLQTIHASATIENSQQQAAIDSTAAFVTLPISSDMQGLVFYFSPNDGTAVGSLRLTYSTSGVVTIPVRGSVLLEADTTDHITGVEFQGSAVFDWALTGTRS